MPLQPEKPEEKVLKSSFSFRKFQVNECHFLFDEVSNEDLTISIDASGTYSKGSKTFVLNLDAAFFDGDSEEAHMRIICESSFLFEEELEEGNVPKYFTVNAPAITFPYIRSYISTLSALSGRSTITLATLNLVRMAGDLENNISFID